MYIFLRKEIGLFAIGPKSDLVRLWTQKCLRFKTKHVKLHFWVLKMSEIARSCSEMFKRVFPLEDAKSCFFHSPSPPSPPRGWGQEVVADRNWSAFDTAELSDICKKEIQAKLDDFYEDMVSGFQVLRDLRDLQMK